MKSKFLICVSIIILLFLVFFYKEIVAIDAESFYNGFFNAKVYDNAQYNLGGSGLELTNQGVDVTSWNYNSSKYLKINTNLPTDWSKSNFIIGVKIPREFYFSVNEFMLPVGCSKVEFEKNDNFVVNTNYNYQVNEHSGIVYYTVNPGVTTINIQLEIKYDFELWNKLGKSLINQKDQKSIEVKLFTNDKDNLLWTKSVNNCYSEKNFEMISAAIPYIDNKRNNATVELLYKDRKNKILQNSIYIMAKAQNSMKAYYKELRLKIRLPEYVDKKNRKHYLKIDESSIKFNLDVPGKAEYYVDNSDINNGNVTIICKNVYYETKSGRFLFYSFKSPEVEDIDNLEVINFSKLVLNILTVDNSGEEQKIASSYSQPINYWIIAKEKIETRYYSRDVSYLNSREKAVVGLGGFYLRNSGPIDSSSKKFDIIFDDTNSGYIQIVAMNLPIKSKNGMVNIKYKLVDENNRLVYKNISGEYVTNYEENAISEFDISFQVSNAKNLQFNRNLLPDGEKKFFLKEIKYNIDTIKEGESLYSPETVYSNDSMGNYFGYVNYDVNPYKRGIAHSKMIVSDNNTSQEFEMTSILSNGIDSQYMVKDVLINDKESDAEIVAGSSIKLSGNAEVIQYPYGYIPWIKNIVIGLVLPNGISIDRDLITLKTTKNNIIKPMKIESIDLYNGYNLWKVYVPSDIVIGFWNEKFEAIKDGKNINFTFVLNIDENMEAQTIVLNKTIYLATIGDSSMPPILNGAGGSYYWSNKKDEYDLNGNGRFDDVIAGINQANQLSFKVIPQKNFFNIKDSINVNDTNYLKDVNVFKKDDIINYKLSLRLKKGASFVKFNYYVPVLKNDNGRDEYIVKSSKDVLNLSLINKPEIVGNDLYDIFYTKKRGININNVDSAEWISSDKITDFNDVTMVKIVLKSDGVTGGSTDINFKLRYSGSNYLDDVGKKLEIHSAGNIKYTNNGDLTEGIFATDGVNINVKAIEELSDITLTAAPDRKPLKPGNVNESEFDTKPFYSLNKVHKFKILNIESNNVILKSKNDINSNLNMSSSTANTTFGISLLVDGEKEIDLIPNNNYQKMGEILQLGKGKSSIWKYKIYNANNLSENITDRNVVITYESDNGLILKQRIRIKRELKKADDLISTITATREYGLLNDRNKIINNCRNGVCSLQFVMNYIPKLYYEKILNFSNVLPIGTKITLYDYVNDENPTYWYYEVKSSTNTLRLTEFYKMGYVNKKYVNIVNDDLVREVYIFNIDFSNVSENNLENLNMSLEMHGSGVENIKSDGLECNFFDNTIRNFEIDKQDINFDSSLNINYSIKNSLGSDTRINGEKMSYVITVGDDFPKDAYIMSSEDEALGYKDKKYYRNSKNQYILRGNGGEYFDYSFSIKFHTDMNSNIDLFNVKIDLMFSNSYYGEEPLMGELVDTKEFQIRNKVINNSSLEINDINNRVISKSDLNVNQLLEIKYIKNDENKMFIELDRKIGSEYKKISDKLISIDENVINENGVFNLSLDNGDNEVKFKLDKSIEIGTYRLLFIIKDSNNNIVSEIPYNIIVKDDL